MTHDYKSAINDLDEWDSADLDADLYLNLHEKTIRAAIQLAQEAEQLRKERDELAQGVITFNCQGDLNKLVELAKKVRNENGNA